MSDTPEKSRIEALEEKLNHLILQHRQYAEEIAGLKQDIKRLQNDTEVQVSVTNAPVAATSRSSEPVSQTNLNELQTQPKKPLSVPKITGTTQAKLEEFIGTNLLNKIGIAILVLGIGYGVKYSIDHELLSPLTRILLGYLTGGILVGLGYYLKPKYNTFSAVIVSGGHASLYFITYAAFAFYDLIPQSLAFGMMIVFTGATVWAAIQYNMQVVALIGLTGAYTIPLLIGDDSGQVNILFTYITITNGGMLYLSFRKKWTILYYASFIITWFIFAGWWLDAYAAENHLWTGLVFPLLFLCLFYAAFLSYRLIDKVPYSSWDVALMLMNSALFYGFGYASIDAHPSGDNFLGLFTLLAAAIHLAGTFVVNQKSEFPRDVVYLLGGLALLFITIAVPVQLNGNWVTLLWSGEGALLFWIGRTRSKTAYEQVSYPVLIVAFASLMNDWDIFYENSKDHLFLLNLQFASSLWTVGCFSFVTILNRRRMPASQEARPTSIISLFNITISTILVISAFLSVFQEIASFWDIRYESSQLKITGSTEASINDYDLLDFKSLWLMNYAALFTLAASWITLKNKLSKETAYISMISAGLMIVVFLLSGLGNTNNLLQSYLHQTDATYYPRGLWNILIRYVSILIFLPLPVVVSRLLRQEYIEASFKTIALIAGHIFLLFLLSSELQYWLSFSGVVNGDRLALSILWSIYAAGLIISGLRNEHRQLRILGMVLFGITILKLFAYDIEDLPTESKTVVMIILGALLLVSSFLYNKMKKQ